MSWNGTLTCSYCYERGHNKRKCPEMERDHDEYVKLTEAGETVSWRQRSAHREYKEQQETLKESNKVCAFCNKSGHRVLTCPSRLKTVEQVRQINKYYKPLVRSVLAEHGFGKGCLVTRYEWSRNLKGEDEKKDVPYMVTGIDQGALDFCNLKEGFGNITVANMTTMRTIKMQLPLTIKWAILQAVCHLDEYEWGDRYWSDEAKRHPFQQVCHRYNKPDCDNQGVLAPTDTFFPEDSLFYPLKSKRDINKMFREHKKRGDQDRFYVQDETRWFVTKMTELLAEHKGWKL
jgi:hypothetical protein